MLKNPIKMLLFLFAAFTFALTLYGCSGSDCDNGGGTGSGPNPIVKQGSVSGTVTGSGAPLAGAQVTLTDARAAVVTDANGYYEFTNLAAGNYAVTASAQGFASQTKTVALLSNTDKKTADFSLVHEQNPALGTLHGTVSSSADAAIKVGDAVIILLQNGAEIARTTSNPDGTYSIPDLAPGTYTVQVSAAKYAPQELNVNITPDPNPDFNIALVPALFSKLYGGSLTDFADYGTSHYNEQILAQPDGTFWICGAASSKDGDLASSPSKGNKDGWVFRVDPSKPDGQQIVYSLTMGGSYDDFFTDMKIAGDGTIWLCGITASTNGDIENAVVPNHGAQGTRDGWLIHLDPKTNQILYNRCIGGSGNDDLWRLELSGDTVWLCGETWSNDGDNTNANHHETGWQVKYQDAWLVQVKPAENQIVFNQCYGGARLDSFNNFYILPDNTFWCSGNTESNDGDLANSVVNLHGEPGNRDGWLVHIDTTKPRNEQILYSRCFGGTKQDVGHQVIYNNAQDIWLVCRTHSIDGDPGSASVKNHGPEDTTDLWLLKVNPTLPADQQIIYNRCFGGTTDDGEGLITMLQDTDGSLWLATDTASTDGDLAQASVTNHGGTDIWLLHLDSSGNILSSVCKGGTGDEYTPVLALSGNYLWAVCASTSSASGDVTPTNHGSSDAWLFNSIK